MKSCPDCTATYPDDYAICPKDGAPLHETSLWQVGTVVKGKYRIQARLGEGGMAVVYKAHHELLDELRALKVIRPDLARDSEFMGRFRNEAIMARKLNHPNAVRVDDLDIAEDGLPFIAMELVVGDTLKTLIQRVGPLPVSLVLDITLHVCEALDAAHKLGLIHRDIKPDNIVLIAQRDSPPTAKILDFGISRLRQETSGAKGLTQTGMVIGTPEYMSPEQVMGKKGTDIDGRSDLYSLGIVMYRMLTGELPFTGETTVEMFLQHLHTPPQAPHAMKPELAIPESVSAIVMKAMDKDREKRFATGAEMAAAIRKARGSTTLSTKKVDWDSLSTATATFGAETDAPGAPVARAAVASVRPTSTPSTGPVGPAIERSAYRQPKQVGRRADQFPVDKIIKLATVIALIVGSLVGWRYYRSWRITKDLAAAPAGIGPSEPAKSPETARPGEQASEPPRTNPAPTTSGVQRPGSRKDLTDAEKARITELNNTGAEYYREGGCEKALPPYQKVLDIDPGNPKAYSVVRDCMLKARRGQNGPTIQTTIPVTPPPEDSSPPPSN